MPRFRLPVVLATTAVMSTFAVLPASAQLVSPAYNSRPTANATLFIDLDGITYPGTWGGKTPGTVPAYDTDGNTGSFSNTELNNIRQIWSRVSEMFSPFDINVTTVDPGVYNSRVSSRIIVGGDNAWYGGGGGVANLGGFASTSLSGHTGWVFQANAGGNSNSSGPFNLAGVIAHEAGHQFGLSHQSVFDANNAFTSEYRGSTDGGFTAPIMGTSYQGSTASLPRALWSDGPRSVNSTGTQQLDLGVLASTTANRSPNNGSYYNGFGYRADDHGNSAASASALTIVSGATPKRTASGVITQNTDRDFFKFDSTGGLVTIAADGAEFGQMLDILMRVYDSTLQLLATIDPALTKVASNGFGLDASYTSTLAAGSYFVDIGSYGGYGDIGQYTLNVTGAVAVPEPAAFALVGFAGLALLRRRRGN